MNTKFNFCLLLSSLFTINGFAQNATLGLSKEQKLKDSIEFAKFKKNYPENFLNKRLAGYFNGYNICNLKLQLNDQVLIEIKNDKNKWMIDRYNLQE